MNTKIVTQFGDGGTPHGGERRTDQTAGGRHGWRADVIRGPQLEPPGAARQRRFRLYWDPARRVFLRTR